ncbi:MAG: Gfo/Idh/MocA family oxidoreductase [Bryobacteraceae bacterium]
MIATMKPTRRDLVATSFTILAPHLVRGSQANSKISVGLIGCGGRGTHDSRIAHNDPRARVTALCDLFPDRVEKATADLKLDKPTVFRDFEKMLAAPDIDAVFIASPPFEHPRMFEAAVDAKKHIYCEKPAGVDLPGVKRFIAAARKADPRKTIAVGFQQRYGPVYLEAHKRLTSGAIGELANARGFWIDRDPFTRRPYDQSVEKLRNWFCYRDYSGDILVEQDCHNLDVLHWFLDGLPTRAVGMGGRKIRTTMDILDHLTVAYEFPGGFHVNFEANQITPRPFRKVGEEFTGTKGVLETSRERLIHHNPPSGSKEAEVIASKRDITYDAVENFLSRIQNNDPENVGERSGLSTLIAILGRTSIYAGREATWKGEFGTL